MNENEIQKYILDSLPYPIIYVDTDHIIRYLNKAARYRYYQVRGYGDLIGKSIFDCHTEGSKEKILQAIEKLKNHGNEIFLNVNVYNQRVYINPVRDDDGNLIGYFERFELNLQK
jgi:DUF438 domain-containing protein